MRYVQSTHSHLNKLVRISLAYDFSAVELNEISLALGLKKTKNKTVRMCSRLE